MQTLGHQNGCPKVFFVYICSMYIREKKNRSGTISVQAIDKSSGKYKMLKSFGSSSDPIVIEKLRRDGKMWINSYGGQLDMVSLFEKEETARREKEEAERVLGNVENILINGTQLILDKVFNLIGFDAINDDVLKQLVIARLCQPSSKAGTVDYLKSYYDEDVNLSIFRQTVQYSTRKNSADKRGTYPQNSGRSNRYCFLRCNDTIFRDGLW